MLRSSHRFQVLVEKLIALANANALVEPFDLFTRNHLLTIQNPSVGIAPLIVTAIGNNLIYVDQRLDDGRSDPGVAFFVEPKWVEMAGGWLPVGITQLFPGFYAPYVTLAADFSRVTRCAMKQQASVASFCNGMWWGGLSEQGFTRLTAKTIRANIDVLIYSDAEVSSFVHVEGEEADRG